MSPVDRNVSPLSGQRGLIVGGRFGSKKEREIVTLERESKGWKERENLSRGERERQLGRREGKDGGSLAQKKMAGG